MLASADWHLSQGERPAVLIGKDTRISGYMLEAALQAGLSAAGVDSAVPRSFLSASSCFRALA